MCKGEIASAQRGAPRNDISHVAGNAQAQLSLRGASPPKAEGATKQPPPDATTVTLGTSSSTAPGRGAPAPTPLPARVCVNAGKAIRETVTSHSKLCGTHFNPSSNLGIGGICGSLSVKQDHPTAAVGRLCVVSGVLSVKRDHRTASCAAPSLTTVQTPLPMKCGYIGERPRWGGAVGGA